MFLLALGCFIICSFHTKEQTSVSDYVTSAKCLELVCVSLGQSLILYPKILPAHLAVVIMLFFFFLAFFLALSSLIIFFIIFLDVILLDELGSCGSLKD